LKKKLWISAILVLLVSISAVWFFRGYVTQISEVGFKIVSLENNALLISDADVVSYNWTNQEITITDKASERLTGIGDSLYNFSDGFVVRIDGNEVYRGVFRTAIMSAIPSPPKISMLYPSMLFPSQSENRNAIRMFFPWFEPPSDQPEENTRFYQYFKDAGKLSC
jgi:hypothetical protein